MKAKTIAIAMNKYGSFLGMERGVFLLRDKQGKEARYPLFENEIGEVQVTSGNLISTGVLASLGFWEIPLIVLTKKGNPVAILKSLTDDSHVETRIAQYQALTNGKGLQIAKSFVTAKLEGQNQVLRKYGLRGIDFSYFEAVKSLESEDIRTLRRRLMSIEGKCSTLYFREVFSLFPELLRPSNRKTYRAYDGLNNLFSLAYRILFWKVYVALTRSKLEPYLGFLHSLKFGTPSLVCDVEEVYRYMIDDFVIGYARRLTPKDFVLKTEDSGNRKGKREFLNDRKTGEFSTKLGEYFRSRVYVPRIMRGEKQELETLINEEALLLGKYLRGERKEWTPRIVPMSSD